MYAGLNTLMGLLIEPDTVFGVSDNVGKGFDAIGYIGKGIFSCIQQAA